MLLRRIRLKSKKLNTPVKKGLFMTLKGLAVILAIVLLAAVICAGLVYSRMKAKISRKDRLLETRQLVVMDLRERHKALQEEIRSRALDTMSYELPGLRQVVDLFKGGNYGACLKQVEMLLAKNNIEQWAERELLLKGALCQFYLHDSDAALKTIERALKKFPDDSYPYEQARCGILLENRMFREANAHVRRLCVKFPRPATLLTRGVLSWGFKEYNRAAQDFLEVLAAGDPVLLKAAANNLALLYAESMRDFKQAYFYLEMLRKIAPVDLRTNLTAGRVLLLAKDYTRAEKYLLQALKTDPDNVEACLNLAALYEKRGDDARAKKFMKTATGNDPTAPKKAERLSGARTLVGTETFQNKRNSRPPRTPLSASQQRKLDTLIIDINQKLRNGLYGEGLKLIESAKIKFPSSASLEVRRSRALMQLKRIDEAQHAVTRSLEHAPNDTEALLNAAAFNNASGRRIVAEKFFLRVLRHEPNCLDALRGVTATYLSASMWDFAEGWAKRALVFYPGDPQFVVTLASSFAGRGDYKRALAQCESHLAGGGADMAAVRLMMASCFKALNKPVKSIEECYIRALKAEPDNTTALNIYIAYLAENGRADMAVALTGKLLRLSGRAPYALDTAGMAYFKAGQAQRARFFLSEALEKAPLDAIILFHNAIVSKKLGLARKSREFYQGALKNAQGRPEQLRMIKDGYAK